MYLRAHTVASMWRSEHSFVGSGLLVCLYVGLGIELGLSFMWVWGLNLNYPLCGFGDSTWVISLAFKHVYLLSNLASLRYTF